MKKGLVLGVFQPIRYGTVADPAVGDSPSMGVHMWSAAFPAENKVRLWINYPPLFSFSVPDELSISTELL